MKGTVQLRYALVNGIKKEPQKDENGGTLHGSCPLCGSEVIAKCGHIRVKHWAHKSNMACETYSRDMSDWHKDWQDKFPIEWREEPIINKERTERHIADVCTADGLGCRCYLLQSSNETF